MKKIFWMKGKVNRKEFIFQNIILFFCTGIILGFISEDISNIVVLTYMVLSSFLIVKRFHDLSMSGRYFWALCIPIYNIYLAIILLFKKGKEGENNRLVDTQEVKNEDKIKMESDSSKVETPKNIPPLPSTSSKKEKSVSKQSNSSSYLDRIRGVCKEFEGQGFKVGDNIKKKKLSNAYKYFPIPKKSKVIALIDSTVFGSNKTGLAICNDGLYIKNDWTADIKFKHLQWEDIINSDITLKGYFNVKIGRVNDIVMSGSNFKRKQLVKLLKEIKDILKITDFKVKAKANHKIEKNKEINNTPPTPPLQKEKTKVVDINKASEKEISELYGIGPIIAKKVINLREEKNGFSSFNDFKDSVNLANHIAKNLKNKLEFSELPDKEIQVSGRLIDF